MFGYIVRRMISGFLVVTAISMMTFALFALGPTNTADYLCQQNGHCTTEKLATIEKGLGLDKPIVEQYGVWAKGLVHDRTISFGGANTYQCDAPCLGISYNTQTQVTKELKKKYPVTLSLAIGGVTLYLLFGVTTGVLSARRAGSLADKALVGSTLVVTAIPYYLFAFLSWLYLVNEWAVFPDATYTSPFDNPAKWVSGLLLPWIVLGIFGATQYARFSRGSMIEALSEDFVRTAVAKGVRTRTVTIKHALRAAVVPVVTILGLDFGSILGGAIFTEYIWQLDGVGRWSLQSIGQFDYPVVAATVLTAAFFIVLANVVVDILYSVLDPRVRLV
jgi:peptide/nickel transport system permease protein